MRVLYVRRSRLTVAAIVVGLVGLTQLGGVSGALAATYGTPTVAVGAFQASGDGVLVSVTATLGDGVLCGDNGCPYMSKAQKAARWRVHWLVQQHPIHGGLRRQGLDPAVR
jgi:hypothetical protein